MNTCKCGNKCKRKYCPDCIKKARWKKKRTEILANTFTPRISKVLSNLKIEINPSHLTEIKRKKGLYIYGPTGAGKTIYAVSVLLKLIKENPEISYHFIDTSELLLKIKKSFQNESSEFDIINQYTNYDILIIDDLGTEKTTEWALQTIRYIINIRYESLKSTIFTSNMGLNELREQMGDDRIPSRIIEMCKVIKFNNPDYRLES